MRYQKRATAAFTLIELLVVMAITVILLGLIFGPMVQGFNLTNRARVQALTQDVARQAMEEVQRSLDEGMFVGQQIGPTFHSRNPDSITFWVPGPGGQPQPIDMPNAMIEVFLPQRENDTSTLIPTDPTTGFPVDRGQLVVPLLGSRFRIRIWVGLRDNASRTVNGVGQPVKLYSNFYENPSATSLRDHNPYVLYIARYSRMVRNQAGQFVVDTRLFRLDADGEAITDPNFFHDNSVAVAPPGIASAALPGWKDLNGDGQVNICENWRAIARPLVPVDRADLAVVARDENRNPLYDPNTGRMRISSLVKFQSTYVGNDPGVPTSQTDARNEAPITLPSRVSGQFGHWFMSRRIFVFNNDLSSPSLSYFYWVPLDLNPSVKYYDAGSGQFLDTGFYPDLVASYPVPRVDFGALNPNVPQILMTATAVAGQVDFTLPDSCYWHDATGAPVNDWRNIRPLAYDPAAINATKTNPDPAVSQRTLSLLTLPNGQPSPLFQLWNYNASGQKLRNVVITPGSEVVTGPDQRPGPNYGRSVTYTRVPRTGDIGNIGLNEYMINYADLVPGTDDPLLRVGTIIFNSKGDDASALPTSYVDATGAVRPAAPVTVTWRVQNNMYFDGGNQPRASIVRLDYITRQVQTVQIGVRLYDLQSGQPQQMTLTQKFRIRNLKR